MKPWWRDCMRKVAALADRRVRHPGIWAEINLTEPKDAASRSVLSPILNAPFDASFVLLISPWMLHLYVEDPSGNLVEVNERM